MNRRRRWRTGRPGKRTRQPIPPTERPAEPRRRPRATPPPAARTAQPAQRRRGPGSRSSARPRRRRRPGWIQERRRSVQRGLCVRLELRTGVRVGQHPVDLDSLVVGGRRILPSSQEIAQRLVGVRVEGLLCAARDGGAAGLLCRGQKLVDRDPVVNVALRVVLALQEVLRVGVRAGERRVCGLLEVRRRIGSEVLHRHTVVLTGRHRDAGADEVHCFVVAALERGSRGRFVHGPPVSSTERATLRASVSASA